MLNHYADLNKCNTSIECAIEEEIAPELPICTPEVYSDAALSDLECVTKTRAPVALQVREAFECVHGVIKLPLLPLL